MVKLVVLVSTFAARNSLYFEFRVFLYPYLLLLRTVNQDNNITHTESPATSWYKTGSEPGCMKFFSIVSRMNIEWRLLRGTYQSH